MKKIFALACATSALAIVSAANAGDVIRSTGSQLSVEIKGFVPGYCTLSKTGVFSVSDNGKFASNGDNTGILQIESLGNASGFVNAVNLKGSFDITANEVCSLSLVSANGGLVNLDNKDANKISYKAAVYQDGAGTPVLADTQAFSAFNTKFDRLKLGNGPVNFAFEIPPGTVPVAAGNYQDTLTIAVSPTI